MAEPRLGPNELDRLEDALEGLEALDDLHDPSEAVSNRLADFQFILKASREALPLEDVRPGLLDGVLSEARMSAPDTLTPAAEPSPTPSFWTRMRKAWLVPGLAVAGSAALVLILVKPMLGESPQLEEAGAVATNKDSSRVQAEPTPSPGSAPEAARARDLAPASKAVAGQANSEGAASSPAAPATATPRSTVKQSDAPTLEPMPEAEPSPELPDAAADAAVKGGKKDEAAVVSEKGWNAIEQGDSAREGGDCFSARNHYARALDDGNDSVRARAYAGMGLCKRKDGNSAAADEYFDKARELDEDAVRFADTRADEKPAKPSSRRPKKKASRKRKKSMDFDEAMDPFEAP